MSYLVDTHCHLQDRQFFSADEAEEMLRHAHENGVEKIICIGTDPLDSLVARDFAATHEGVYWTYGVHPEEWMKNNSKFSRDEKLVAIGEVGLDYHTDGYEREAQIKLFEEMLQLASDNHLPVSFHVREAYSDFFAIVKNFPDVRGVVHCFTDSKKNMKRILNETDFYVGMNGIMTYSTLALPPLERVLLETDAPFLAPVPFRGEKNEPAFIYNIAEWASTQYGKSFELVQHETTKNAENLFRFGEN